MRFAYIMGYKPHKKVEREIDKYENLCYTKSK